MNKILLIFYGGSTFFDKKKGFLSVEKELDIKKWINEIPEISLMAQIEGLFIDNHLNEDSTKKMILEIKNNIDKFDGVIILNDSDTIPLLSNQLFWQIQNPSKPIVITGSNIIERGREIVPDLSFKANLINALQIVNSNLNKISVIYGNRVIAAPKIVRTKLQDLNIFKSIDQDYLAKIDFGLTIKDKEQNKKSPKYYTNFSNDFLFLDNVPDIENLGYFLEQSQFKVIVFKGWSNQIISKEKLVKIFKLAIKKKKIIVFYNQIGFTKDFFKDTIITISKISPECLSAKLSWILGQTKDDKKIRDLLKEKIQNEFLNL